WPSSPNSETGGADGIPSRFWAPDHLHRAQRSKGVRPRVFLVADISHWRRSMAQMLRDVMTKDPVSMSSDASVAEAAKAMSDLRIGTVVVMEQDKPCGIVTDRDITVRAVATGGDASTVRLADIRTRAIAPWRRGQSVAG